MAKEYKNAASTVSLILVEEDQICLVKRKYEPFKDMWCLPGGFLNYKEETLEQAAVRELLEETNLVAKEEDLTLFCVNSAINRDPRDHVIDHIYIVENWSGLLLASDDASEIKFFYLDDLPELAFDHKEVIRKYLERGKERDAI